MRIALITPGFSARADDWAIPALLNFARTLSQTSEVYVFSQRYPAKGVYPFNGLIHHAMGGGQNFGMASIKIWRQTAQAIIRQHQKTPFDVLHAFWADEAGFSAVLAAGRINRPVIVSIGGGELTRLPQYGAQRFLVRRLTTQFALKRASVVTAGSTYQLNLCRAHHIPKHKLHLAPLGVDTKQFNDQLPMTNYQYPTLIQAASLIPVKNQTLLLHTLALVKNEIPDIKLNLVGSGPLQSQLVKLANQLNLSQNITWHGPRPYPEMSRLFRQAHLYVQSSQHESQGMAVLEAMACGLPVLGTPVGVAQTLACRPANSSPEILAQQIVEVLGNESLYPPLSRQARQTVETTYSLPVTTNNFINIYSKIITQPLL